MLAVSKHLIGCEDNVVEVWYAGTLGRCSRRGMIRSGLVCESGRSVRYDAESRIGPREGKPVMYIEVR